jgi:hypothetical protein
MKIYYYYPDVWSNETPDIEDAYEISSNRDIYAVRGSYYDEMELSWLIEDMAGDFFSNHDGWELADAWHGQERVFAVWDSNKTFIGLYDVTLEYEPRFTAWRKK